MKKIFKGLAVLAATAAVGTGVAFAAGCGGSDGVYEGSYSYTNWGHTYGMSVKVTVKNNIITKVEDTTPADWTSVSDGYRDYYAKTQDITPSAVYTIVTKTGSQIKTDLGLDDSAVRNFRPNPCTFNIAVGEDGVIKSLKIVTDGSTSGYGDRVADSIKDGSWFVGKTAEDILAAFNGDIGYDKDNGNIGSNDLITGASQTSFLYLQAAAFASANAADVFAGKKISALTNYKDVIDIASSDVEIVEVVLPDSADFIPDYAWSNDSAAHWTNYKSYLLQQYEGWTVADVLNIKVYVKESGEPYEVKGDGIDSNPFLAESGLLITGATQGSGRLLLAVQNALKK